MPFTRRGGITADESIATAASFAAGLSGRTR